MHLKCVSSFDVYIAINPQHMKWQNEQICIIIGNDRDREHKCPLKLCMHSSLNHDRVANKLTGSITCWAGHVQGETGAYFWKLCYICRRLIWISNRHKQISNWVIEHCMLKHDENIHTHPTLHRSSGEGPQFHHPKFAVSPIQVQDHKPFQDTSLHSLEGQNLSRLAYKLWTCLAELIYRLA